jgi:hypothetical protein
MSPLIRRYRQWRAGLLFAVTSNDGEEGAAEHLAVASSA